MSGFRFGRGAADARMCGNCRLCCRLPPIPELKKEAGAACKYLCNQPGRACRIYTKRPKTCFGFFCMWRLGKADTMRPDQMGCYIDHKPDFVNIGVDGGERKLIPCFQVWADPQKSNCHRHPSLLHWIEEQWYKQKMLALIRYGPGAGAVLFVPPDVHGCHAEWQEMSGEACEREHATEKIVEVLKEHRRSIVPA